MIVYRARTLLACIVCCILGCATPYRPPVDGPTASVRFVNESGLAGKVTSYADEECNKDAHSGELAALGVEPDKKETTVVVAANRPLIFTFLTGSRGGPLGIAGWENMNCSMTLRFVPEESVQYNVT